MSNRKPTPANAGASAPQEQPAPASAQEPPAGDNAASEGADPESTDEPGEEVEVRVLLAFDGHKPNAVTLVSADRLARLKTDGLVDDDADAIVYARGLQA